MAAPAADRTALRLTEVLTADQWAQLAEAIGEVEAAGYGEVQLVFEDGLPRFVIVTVARVYVSFDQVLPAVAAVQRAGWGSVAVNIRNGHSIRLEATTQAKMVQPPHGGRV